MTRDSARRPEGEKPSGFEGVARQNGARSAIAPLPLVTTLPIHCTSHLWPPEVMSEMQAIWKGTGS